MKIPRFLWWKRYFDTGLALTNYAKYGIALMGLYSIGKNIDVNYTLLVGIGYVIFCFVAGYFWIKHKMTDCEHEIDNLLNPFAREVRLKLNGRNQKRR